MFVRNEYDMVLMDINIQEMNGFDAANLIKSINPEVLIIGFSSLNDAEIRKMKKINKNVFDTILKKPFNIKTLVKTVNSYTKTYDI